MHKVQLSVAGAVIAVNAAATGLEISSALERILAIGLRIFPDIFQGRYDLERRTGGILSLGGPV